HPVLFLGAQLRPGARQPASLRSLQVSCFRLSSGVPGCPTGDLCINLQSKSSWNTTGRQIANFGPVLWKPFSRGRVSLASADPAAPVSPALPRSRPFTFDRVQFSRRRAGFTTLAGRLPLGGRFFAV